MLSSASESLYQRVLGARAAELHPALQAYSSMPPVGLLGRGAGVYEVAGSRLRWARPLWAWLAWRHVLFPELGRDIPFTVINTPTSDGRLDAVRRFAFASRGASRERIMEDTMSVVDGHLHDRLGRRRGWRPSRCPNRTDGRAARVLTARTSYDRTAADYTAAKTD